MNLFSTLNTSYLGLIAQQNALQTTSHNVANANTPGFSRQKAIMETTTPLPYPSLQRSVGAGQIGTGVMVGSIDRVRDAFLDTQVWRETASLSSWEEKQKLLEQIEVVFMEPADSSLSGFFEDFWNAWQELSKNAESEAVRTALLESANNLTDSFNHIARQLNQMGIDLQTTVQNQVEEVNSLASQIAALNVQIESISITGDNPNDLLDRRDLLLDELAKYTDFTVVKQNNNVIDIEVDGRKLVEGKDYFEWSYTLGNQVSWAADAEAINLKDGGIKGALDGIGLVNDYKEKLDDVAQNLIEKINDQHTQGHDLNEDDGSDFFSFEEIDGVNEYALTMKVLIEEADKIAAASVDEGKAGGTNALAIAQLRSDIEGDYQKIITALAVDAHQANRMVENQSSLVYQLENRRISVSGVSLDEEMVNLIQFQRAYQANSQAIRVVDELLDTLVNGILR